MMTIRPPNGTDWLRIGELCEQLVRAHHTYDPSRFISVQMLRADTYISRVRKELNDGRAAVFVAEVDERVVGYVFAGIEAESWKELRAEAGFIHDLVVDETSRRSGVGTALLERAVAWFQSRRVERVMLWTAPQNVYAHSLFRRVGFRLTMMEMTLDRT
jgi:GNAT superfamily N-acetyltransferase